MPMASVAAHSCAKTSHEWGTRPLELSLIKERTGAKVSTKNYLQIVPTSRSYLQAVEYKF
jgi:hypothetical protein